MNAKTLSALKRSIRHWERMAASKRNKESCYADGCPLCKLFYEPRTPRSDNCTGCPVKRKTGHSLCRETPWLAAARELADWRNHYGIRGQYVEEEIEFLESLLPKRSNTKPRKDT